MVTSADLDRLANFGAYRFRLSVRGRFASGSTLPVKRGIVTVVVIVVHQIRNRVKPVRECFFGLGNYDLAIDLIEFAGSSLTVLASRKLLSVRGLCASISTTLPDTWKPRFVARAAARMD